MIVPKISYYRYHINTPVSLNDATWNIYLPSGPSDNTLTLTFGDYFDSLSTILMRDDGRVICRVLGQIVEKPVTLNHISTIDIIIEKHGAYYHPSRVEIDISDQHIQLAANVALSEVGCKVIQREFDLITRLNSKFPYQFLPKVYDTASLTLGSDQNLFVLFSQWFDDYHEFHADVQVQYDAIPRIRVWKPLYSPCYLTTKQALQLFHSTALIMSVYYDIFSCRLIYPWTHAAGDFVVCNNKDDLQIKLITARNYQSFMDISTDTLTPRDILDGLISLVLTVTIKNRLDRINGTETLVWGPDIIIGESLKGIWDGLALKIKHEKIDPDLHYALFTYIKSFSFENLLEAAEDLIQLMVQHAAETNLIKKHIYHHVKVLHQLILETDFHNNVYPTAFSPR